jgi:RNA 2',3'-cyclic 3'-phosphodiesterase
LPNSEKKLVFIAVDLPQYIRQAVRTTSSKACEDGRWRIINAKNLHVTLLFLGNRAECEISLVKDALESEALGAKGNEIRLRLDSILLLPKRHPRVLAIGINDLDGALTALHSRLTIKLQESGIAGIEKRPFTPHITVARAKTPSSLRVTKRDSPVSLSLEDKPKFELAEFCAAQVTLYESHLSHSGAEYRPLASFELG